MKLIERIKNNHGSALVFSLIVLFIGVVAAVGIASTTAISRKMSGTTGKSVSSFQVADSGAEIVLKAIKDADSNAKLSDLGGCSDGVITGTVSTGKTYSVNFHKSGDLDNTFVSDCNVKLTDLDKIKSTGTYGETSRAIEAAVAAGESQKHCIITAANAADTDSWEYAVYVPSSWTINNCKKYVVDRCNPAVKCSYTIACFFDDGTYSKNKSSTFTGGSAGPSGTISAPSPNCGW